MSVFLRKINMSDAEHRMVVLLLCSGRKSVTRAKRQNQGTETTKQMFFLPVVVCCTTEILLH